VISMGNPWVHWALPVPIPMRTHTCNLRVFPQKRDLEHPKQIINRQDMLKTLF